MKRTKIILLSLAFASFCHAKGDDKPLTPEQKAAEAKKEIILQKKAQLNEKFSNLPKEQRIKYLKLRSKAGRLFSNKRTFEALLTIYQMQEIFPEDPAALNLLGAIHVDFRNFGFATKLFQKAIDMAGEDPKILFNIAELEFCSNHWEECIKKMKYVQKMLGDNESPLAKIVLFKILLCHLGIAEDNRNNSKIAASHLKIAKDLAKKYDHMTDSPYFYYAKAALDYYNQDNKVAAKWLEKARKIFGSRGVSSWNDTMIEFGYLKAHYGKSYKEDAKSLNLK